MTGGAWTHDLYACRDGWILKYDYDDFLDLVEKRGKAAAALWTRITRKVCRDFIEKKKQSDLNNFNKFGASEDELFFEMKFDLHETSKLDTFMSGGADAGFGRNTAVKKGKPSKYLLELEQFAAL